MNWIDIAKEELNRPEYREDTVRIVNVAMAHGYNLTLKQAEAAWEAYSDSMAAGWIILPEDDNELWLILNGEAF